MAKFIKTHAGLSPLDDDAKQLMQRTKLGAVVDVKASAMRNGRFFGKWWCLAQVIYDAWVETLPPKEYKGQEVTPSFERFRKDLIIWAGYYTPVYAANGEVRLEADSISWAKMREPEFERLYSKTIDAGLNVLRGYSKGDLENRVAQILEFS